MEQALLSMLLLLPAWSSVSYTANDSIYHFCIMIKDFNDKGLLLHRVITAQDFETVTFMCYLYTSRLFYYFLLTERVSNQLNSLFTLYIFTVKSFIHFHSQTSLLVWGYIEMKINQHQIW